MKRSKESDSSRTTKKGKGEPIFKWPTDDTNQLRKNLNHIQDKLKRIYSLAPRLSVEEPNMQIEDIVVRLHKRRSQLVKKLISQKQTTRQTHRGTFRQLGQQALPPGYYLNPNINVSTPSLYISGSVAPSYRDFGFCDGSINHNSKQLYGLDDSFYSTTGDLLFSYELYDDAAWYRDDNPDWAVWAFQNTWEFPPFTSPLWIGAIIHCRVCVYIHAEFTNGTDDGGWGMHGVTFGYTDPDGVWPIVSIDETTRTVLADMTASGTYESGWRAFDFNIRVKKNVKAGLAMLCETQLSAQDGIVKTLGSWCINEAQVPPAALSYTMEGIPNPFL